MMKWFFHLFRHFLPADHPMNNDEKRAEEQARVEYTISQYQDMSEELRSLIDQNNFARYLRYEGKKKVGKPRENT